MLDANDPEAKELGAHNELEETKRIVYVSAWDTK
jgi:hypothetical protein